MRNLKNRSRTELYIKDRGLNEFEVKIKDGGPPIELETDLKVTWYDKLWMKINGKKTLIGGCVVAARTKIPGFWGVVVQAVGAVIAFIGGVHKTKKIGNKLNSKTSGDKINWIEVLMMLLNLIKQIIIKKKEKDDGMAK